MPSRSPEDLDARSRDLVLVPGNGLHRECVEGIAAIVREMTQSGRTRFNLKEILEIGTAGRSEDAETYIFEFIKDGLVNLTADQVDKIGKGDLRVLRSATNQYLLGFGYQPETKWD